MKKICILSAVNIRHMSLISLYTDLFIKNNISFDIIYMDKYDEEEEIEAKNIFRYVNKIDQKKPKWYKALKYFKFRNYAINIIKRNNYDYIVVWNDLAIFMFADFLANHYKKRYCLNIRDYCYQNIRWVFNRFEKVIKNSDFNTISSKGYEEFLPKFNYLIIHSLNPILFDSIVPRKAFRDKDNPIRIGFIGYVRYFERNEKMLDLFKNDPRFELHYYGTKANVLRDYAEKNGINNAVFYDTFPVKDTYKYLQNIDIINNLYGNDSVGVNTALSIKLYHGIYTRIPILVSANTYMEEVAKKYNIGFTFAEITNDYKNNLYEWYTHLDFGTFNEGCGAILSIVEEQNSKFNQKVHDTFII